MHRRALLLLLPIVAAACGGIPLRSMPRLMRLKDAIFEMDPAEFMFAIQVDERMTPPAGSAPVLHLAIKPARPDGFEPIERALPMQFTQGTAGVMNLAPAPTGRRWMLYSFPPASQAELARIQNRFKQIRAEGRSTGGGSVSVGIAQEGVAARDPRFTDTRWESWLQTSRAEGFYELWSGTVGELLKNTKPQASGAESRA